MDTRFFEKSHLLMSLPLLSLQLLSLALSSVLHLKWLAIVLPF